VPGTQGDRQQKTWKIRRRLAKELECNSCALDRLIWFPKVTESSWTCEDKEEDMLEQKSSEI
jgi:hypothetical protein